MTNIFFFPPYSPMGMYEREQARQFEARAEQNKSVLRNVERFSYSRAPSEAIAAPIVEKMPLTPSGSANGVKGETRKCSCLN